MKSNLVRVDFRKNDKSEKARDNHGFRFNQQKLFEAKKSERANALKEVKRLCKEFGFTAGMLKGSLAKCRGEK